MTKKERYYNFIVDDMVKKTDIDYERESVILPSHPSIHSVAYFTSFLSWILPYTLFDYIQTKYGTRGGYSGEVQMIWDLYKERIKIIIDNEQ